jgi:hypothetical protein
MSLLVDASIGGLGVCQGLIRDQPEDFSLLVTEKSPQGIHFLSETFIEQPNDLSRFNL